jgi:peptidoglycan hydrolase-like protein with peptidoglycan-binding domain
MSQFNFQVEPFELASELNTEVNRNSRDYIKWVQQSLNQIMGLRLNVDGISGVQTRAAIRSFQQREGLQADGTVGLQTERALTKAGAGYPSTGLSTSGTVTPPLIPSDASASSFIVGGVSLPPPSELNIRNFLDPRVPRFPGRNRRGRSVYELIVHETVTRSVADTIKVLNKRGLGVHMIMGPNGEITQHGDLADKTEWHASQHNGVSVGIEVVNPYYPKYLQPGLPWTQVISAGWAHEGRYVVPTPQQAEAVSQLIEWITSPAAAGLAIPRTWIGRSGPMMAMGRMAGAEKRKPGVYAHTYFAHADGSWLVLYAFLRIEKGRTPAQAYGEAIQLATTSQQFVTIY